MSDIDLLREFVMMQLCEKAKATKDASAGGLALFIRKERNSSMMLGLYDPNIVINLVQKSIDVAVTEYQKRTKRKDFNIDAFYEGIPDIYSAFYGFITTGLALQPAYAYGAREVSSAAAKSGWGPLMYDIALKMNKKGLMPDRSSVSSAAAGVWKYYDDKRKDVKALQLDDVDDPKTKTTKDDSVTHNDPKHPEIDKAYQLKSSGPNVDALIRRHKKCVQDIKNLIKKYELSYDQEDIDDVFESAGLEYFDNQYRR